MDSLPKSFHLYGFHHQIFNTIKTQNQQIYQTPPPLSPHSHETSSPILIIAILGIITTAFLLLSYYIFVIKCWLNWHRIGVISRLSFRRYEDPLMVYDPSSEHRGVDESVIRSIPIFQFKKIVQEKEEEDNFHECSVCLNEFQEEENLRVLPSCSHAFHIDCIDIWLQKNDNCPLCRSSISITTRYPFDQILAPSSSPLNQIHPFTETVITTNEDFVVIEIMGDNGEDQVRPNRRQESSKSGELEQTLSQIKETRNKKSRKFPNHVLSMGDECINSRVKDDQFSIKPIRRSISMDSSIDRQLYLSVQEMIQQNMQQKNLINDVSTSEESSGRVRRSIFSFSHGRGSKNAVLPIQFES